MPIAISNAGLCGGVIGTSSTYILYKMYSLYLFHIVYLILKYCTSQLIVFVSSPLCITGIGKYCEAPTHTREPRKMTTFAFSLTLWLHNTNS